MFKSKTQMIIYLIIFCLLIYAFIYLWKKEVGALTKCSKCGATIRPHRACTKCGNYKNQEVIKVEASKEN